MGLYILEKYIMKEKNIVISKYMPHIFQPFFAKKATTIRIAQSIKPVNVRVIITFT
jgi:hypothetical protein